ncbi:hypothetical protein [Calidifontibacter indicus]|uniref:hypothetical protein n=1 Tax=Calidifontibacter indicus TaxID=419650 RepID=UPI003D731F24
MTASPNGLTFVVATLTALAFGSTVYVAGLVADTMRAYRRLRRSRAIVLPTVVAGKAVSE